jgi:hypothetical protein
VLIVPTCRHKEKNYGKVQSNLGGRAPTLHDLENNSVYCQ